LNVAIALLRQVVALDIQLQRSVKSDIENLKSSANGENW